jgi:hypothetical protein
MEMMEGEMLLVRDVFTRTGGKIGGLWAGIYLLFYSLTLFPFSWHGLMGGAWMLWGGMGSASPPDSKI